MRKYVPDRYIVHPVRVMKLCHEYTSDPAILSAALLHDVLEDTSITGDEIKQFMTQLTDEKTALRTLKLVQELTDEYVKNRYPRMNRKERKQREAARMKDISPEAQLVKYADIIDNAEDITTNDPEFAPVFVRECADLMKVLTTGNEQLRERTLKTLGNSMQRLNADK